MTPPRCIVHLRRAKRTGSRSAHGLLLEWSSGSFVVELQGPQAAKVVTQAQFASGLAVVREDVVDDPRAVALAFEALVECLAALPCFDAFLHHCQRCAPASVRRIERDPRIDGLLWATSLAVVLALLCEVD